ncbi:sigma-70 family RNA polymerase sigma factor [Uliginosibacterium aquaticum]|uniref:Sigma-70 family RNA polymerase sigma factor n=1 Tax=Uliginosibacterium aquaticum TaxID=2731212 RepID=A0ABX2IE75_9RHOO|nr:sigma-70 family RNA polymerase sigma factor [Uliginosibacterium aquaticum]NSL54950.1 sigma-70 family RNA polymerase sigma factor [Uliginosibacterium aquaticum]
MLALTHEGLYREHHSWLKGWLRGRLGYCSDRAADFAQETFLRILQAGERPPELEQPRQYLATIARGLLVDHFRRQDLERAYLAELASLPEAAQPSLEERAILLETLLEIDRMLDGLGTKAKRAFLLSQLDGWSYAEIATELGVSVSSVKKYMQKAVLQCLQCL